MGVMLATGALAPWVLYPVFVMKVLCFALFRLRVQPADRLRRVAVVRPCGLFRRRRLRRGPHRQGVGWPPELAIASATVVARGSARRSAGWRSAARASTLP